MMRFFKYIVLNFFNYGVVAALSVIGTLYFTVWQDEDLRFEVSDPMRFGEVVYQNVYIDNKGWNPAENVQILFKTEKPIGEDSKEYRSYPPMNIPANDKEMTIGGFDRIRRTERVTLTFLSKDQPITPEILLIKSDRSIATKSEKPVEIDYSFWILCAILFWMFLAIAIPATKDYQKRKQEVLAALEKRTSKHGERLVE